MSLKTEIANLTLTERLFIPLAMLVCFCIGVDYAMVRPASQSIFLGVFSAKAFPAIWLATVPLNFAVVTLYNRFLPRWGALNMMGVVALSIFGINALTSLIVPYYPEFIFFHFCWKDIYILLMFKQLWSMIHSTIPGKAKYLYGVIFGLGTVGGILGSLAAGFAAPWIGSERLFLATGPIYALLYFAYRKAYLVSGALDLSVAPDKAIGREGFSLIAKNRYLLLVLLLVVFMQVSVALVDYQFSHEMEIAFPEKDARTAFCAKAISLINTLSLLIQFVGSFFLLNWLGLRRSHFLVPLVLSLTAIGQWMVPGVAMVAFAFIFTKAIDFSLFGVLREMLFIPLNLDEKFRAKVVIDVFAYRTSKAFASFLLLGLQLLVGSAVFALANYLLIALFCSWLVVLSILFRKFDLQTATSKAPV